MASETDFKGKKAYKCDDCGFAYADRETAQECEDWCVKHGTCSMKITRKALR